MPGAFCGPGDHETRCEIAGRDALAICKARNASSPPSTRSQMNRRRARDDSAIDAAIAANCDAFEAYGG